MIVTLTLFACKDDLKSVVKHPTNPEKVPTMVSRDVQTIISDSGHTRYRITTQLWCMFEEAKIPHWTFPEGVVAEEMDSTYKIVATIRCDSAYYNRTAQTWSLNGNVRITNVAKDLILTNQLFWNQSEHKVYSDSFIHIEKQARVIEGYGYTSNERFTTYELKKVSAIFPIDENKFPRGEGATATPSPTRVPAVPGSTPSLPAPKQVVIKSTPNQKRTK